MKFSNHDTERVVLGALLGAETMRQRASELISAAGLVSDDFTHMAGRAAFGAIRTIADRAGVVDGDTVWSVLKGLPGASDLNLDRLRELQGSNICDKGAFLTHCIEIKRLTRLRQLEAHHAAQLAELNKPNPNPVELGAKAAAFAQQFTASTVNDSTGEDDVLELAEEWEAHLRGDRPMVCATGIQVLDDEIGGFVNNLNVIGGLPSVGKSALVAEVISNCLGRGLRVGLFGLEDATKWVAKRLAARQSGIRLSEFGFIRLHEHQLIALQESFGKVSALLSNLVTFKQAGIDAAELVQRCKHWVLNMGVRAIFIDHVGEVRHKRTKGDDYRLAVTETYTQLRDFAVNNRVPVIALCHFNRDTSTKQGGVPSMHNFAEAAGVERMARVALGLWEAEVAEDETELRCTVLKRTEGRRGVTLWLKRDSEYALISSSGGGRVDLMDERRRQKKHVKPWTERKEEE